ncbi:CRISPR system precrRNA processing endoribonuclease RAMP protein Cas6 [Shewanella sp. 4t3-1-2LB]|uniref:CRISPR system precrRNA processing endoribonuclease RAMP protein Cas6 n=1 Tax=Shewanella sp. 4t3-1-2LB TaxID=2817682 RepID=UPI001A995FE3|nr:CRISPR system precrRNA processing endoribonuclease RAMP protein Cas6 [Shewanella sp. 4t3-1-2LB]MBO1270824.1 CRISPR system precrRNA processing endoribonuclease RAMP protein Cas6 [Shewanella sp. 4t3-1-2LB]
MTALPIARYRFNCVVTSAIQLPFFSGSALRGAFGHVLRKTSCMTRQSDCTGCPLRQTCPYSVIFDPLPAVNTSIKPEQTPPAYILEPLPLGTRELKAGDAFHFQMVLLGEARHQLALIVFVWEQLLARGLRIPEGQGRLLSVDWLLDQHQSVRVYQPKAALVSHSAELQIPAIPAADTCSLNFVTPTRIRQEGHKMNAQSMDLAALLQAIERRIRLLNKQFGWQWDLATPALPSAMKINQPLLRWQDWVRYSSRQEQEMILGGVLGEWIVSFSELHAWWPMLYLGQWLHVGKNAAFGMGQYQLSLS